MYNLKYNLIILVLPMKHYYSKSKFVEFYGCHKRLWLEYNKGIYLGINRCYLSISQETLKKELYKIIWVSKNTKKQIGCK